MWLWPDRNPELSAFEKPHDTISGGEAVSASSAEADGVDAIDEIAWIECIGLACTRATASNIDAGDRPTGDDYRGRSSLPAAVGALIVADSHASDVGQRSMPKRVCRRTHSSDRSEPVRAKPSPHGWPASSVWIVLGREIPRDTAWVRVAGATKSGIGELISRGYETAAQWAAIGPNTARGRRFGHFGQGSVICFPWVTIMNERYIRIGDGTMIGPQVALSAGMLPGQACVTDPVVSIGDRCLIGRGSGIVGHLSIEIGDDVWTGHHVYITDQNHGYDNPDLPISQQVQPERPVSIGSGSWQGYGSVVLPGAQIGRNVVIGANSVVTGTIPDYSIAVGAPARVIKLLSTVPE